MPFAAPGLAPPSHQPTIFGLSGMSSSPPGASPTPDDRRAGVQLRDLDAVRVHVVDDLVADGWVATGSVGTVPTLRAGAESRCSVPQFGDVTQVIAGVATRTIATTATQERHASRCRRRRAPRFAAARTARAGSSRARRSGAVEINEPVTDGCGAIWSAVSGAPGTVTVGACADRRALRPCLRVHRHDRHRAMTVGAPLDVGSVKTDRELHHRGYVHTQARRDRAPLARHRRQRRRPRPPGQPGRDAAARQAQAAVRAARRHRRLRRHHQRRQGRRLRQQARRVPLPPLRLPGRSVQAHRR